VAASQGADRIGDPQALTNGFGAAFLGAATIAVAGGLLAVATLRAPTTRPPAVDAQGRGDAQASRA